MTSITDINELIVEEYEDSCCAVIKQIREVEIEVTSKMPSILLGSQGLPIGYNYNGVEFIKGHEERRLQTYINAYNSYYETEKEALMGKSLCCEKKGIAQKRVNIFYQKVTGNRDKLVLSYLQSENALISKEMNKEQYEYDKNGLINGSKYTHPVRTPESPPEYELKCE